MDPRQLPRPSAPPPRSEALQRLLEPVRLRRLAQRILRDEADVDDVIQDLWVQSLRLDPGPVQHPEAWLRRAIVNRAASNQRSEARRRRREEFVSSDELTAATVQLAMCAEAAERILAAIDELRPPDAWIIRERFFEERCYEAISEELEVPPSTVRTRLSRALQRLRVLLGEGGHPRDAVGWAPMLIDAFQWSLADISQEHRRLSK